jgi:hypothetical protein
LLAFIHVAKTGGRSVSMLLRSTYGPRYVRALPWRVPAPGADPFTLEFVVPKYDVEDYRRLKRLCPGMRCVGGHAVALWSGLHEVEPTRYFAFMREPLKRGASHFQYHVRTETDPLAWERWLAWPVHQNHQVKLFARSGDAEEAIRAVEKHEVFIGLTERFDESLVILKRLVAPELNLAYRRRNVARDDAIAAALLADFDRREQLRRMYAAELPFFEYVAHELYPRFQREYGPTLESDVEAFRRRRLRVNWPRIALSSLYQNLVVRRGIERYRRRNAAGPTDPTTGR